MKAAVSIQGAMVGPFALGGLDQNSLDLVAYDDLLHCGSVSGVASYHQLSLPGHLGRQGGPSPGRGLGLGLEGGVQKVKVLVDLREVELVGWKPGMQIVILGLVG
jgi:hypothetical protein